MLVTYLTYAAFIHLFALFLIALFMSPRHSGLVLALGLAVYLLLGDTAWKGMLMLAFMSGFVDGMVTMVEVRGN